MCPTEQPPLPGFIIIGAQKSATRWLRVNLGRHPEIYAATSELGYFDHKSRLARGGVGWYRAQFSEFGGKPVVGEATPGYLMWRNSPGLVASRIHELLPDVRLIAVLRDPVDRANSAMIHHIKQERLPPSSTLREMVRRMPPEHDRLGLVTGGWYAASLAPFRRRFGEKLLVLLYDDVKNDPAGVYEKALGYLGVDTKFQPPELNEVVYSNQQGEADGRWDLSVDDRRELYEYFRDDVRQLEELIERDLSMWDPRVGSS
jgi:hypothetical protein